MRMAILLHEFSHYYLNSDVANETEADLNGLTIYLGLGYPIREAYQAFTSTFIGYPTEQNKQRYDIIDKFISLAHFKSSYTCEQCGNENGLQRRSNGWLFTMCEECLMKMDT